MTNQKSKLTRTERRLFASVHFLFGFGIISWVTRFADVKKNLGLGNAEFGSLLTLGIIGSLTSFLVMGHLVHVHGVRRILTISTISMMTLISFATWVTSPILFMFVNILIAASISGFHVSITTQTIWIDEHLDKGVVSRMSGIWSIGALATSFTSIVVARIVSIEIHITILSLIVIILMLIAIKKTSSIWLEKNPRAARRDAFELAKFFTSINIDWLVAFGLICGSILEYVTGDWASIYGREELDLNPSLSVVPYFLFILAMVLGRLGLPKFEARFPLQKLVSIAGIAGGLMMGGGIIFGSLIVEYSTSIALVITCVGFFGGGFGVSFMWAVFNLRANQRSEKKTSSVVAQISAFQTVATFLLKNLVAIVAGFLGLPIALLIPCVMLMFVGYFLRRASIN